MPGQSSASADLQRVLWLGGALLVTVLVLPGAHPLWVFFVVLGAIVWRVLVALRGWRPPSNLLLGLLVAMSFAAIVLTHSELRSLEPAITLLALLLAFKFLELRRARDYPMLVMVGLFFLFAWTLREGNLAQGLHLVVATLLLLLALLQVMREAGPWPLPALGRQAATLLGIALPVALVLFVLFPRIPGPLWSVTYESQQNVTGFSDEMRPGEMSSLAESLEVAFRVDFETAPPEDAALYWRGIVLDAFDGQVWRRSAANRIQDSPRPDPLRLEPGRPDVRVEAGPALRYEVLLEPHGYPWLFALDVPRDVLSPGVTWGGVDRSLIASDRVTERLDYRVESVLQARYGEVLTLVQRAEALDLPQTSNRRSLALARSLRNAASSDREFLAELLRRFSEEPFRYTLEIPALGSDPVDRFLFDTRAGFCEQYASALVVLLRGGNVPARVVMGYAGGEWNPITGLYVVRQYRAHAWVEAWLEGLGWVRVDPVAFIDPSRIDPGISNPAALQGADDSDRFRPGSRWRFRVALAWDTANTFWYRYVVGYGQRDQSRLLEWMGSQGDGVRNLLLLLTLVLGSLAFTLLVAAWWSVRAPVDPLVGIWNRVLRRLARRGFRPALGETALAFARRVEEAEHRFAGRLEALAAEYQRLRFGPERPVSDCRAFIRSARAFRMAAPPRPVRSD